MSQRGCSKGFAARAGALTAVRFSARKAVGVLQGHREGAAPRLGELPRAVLQGGERARAYTSAAYKSAAHCLPWAEPDDALLELGATLPSTSADGCEHVTLTPSADVEMTWTMPNKKIFVWRKNAGAFAPGVMNEYKQRE